MIGRGAYAETWKARSANTDAVLAIKVYALPKELERSAFGEALDHYQQRMAYHHPNLLLPLWYEVTDEKMYIASPFCSKGPLRKYIGKEMSEEDLWRLIRDIARGLEDLHSHKVVMSRFGQKLSPDNVLISDGGIFMIDFTANYKLEEILRSYETWPSSGTPIYLAPECFSKDGVRTTATDIWALGAIVYEVITSDAPFEPHGGSAQLQGFEISPLPDAYSKLLRKTIMECLAKNPQNRPTAGHLAKRAAMQLEYGSLSWPRRIMRRIKYKYNNG